MQDRVRVWRGRLQGYFICSITIYKTLDVIFILGAEWVLWLQIDYLAGGTRNGSFDSEGCGCMGHIGGRLGRHL